MQGVTITRALERRTGALAKYVSGNLHPSRKVVTSNKREAIQAI